MTQQSNDFCDPSIMLVLSIITCLATLIGYIFMDQDLVKHGQAEVAAQAELSTIYSRLGYELSAGPATTKGAHNYVGRIIATICSLGVYALWWWADIMREGNDHLQETWAWEDNLSQVIGQAQLAA